MRAPWVLLDTDVELIDEERAAEACDGECPYKLIGCWAGFLMVEDEAPFGGTSKRAASEAKAIRRKGKQVAAGGSVGELHRMAQAIKLFAHYADPPQVSRFSLVVSEPEKKVEVAFLTSIDKNLFLIYAGPCSSSWDNTGYHLIFDAARNSLTVIPEMPGPYLDYICIMCPRAVLLQGDEGAYVLAMLIRTHIFMEGEATLALGLWEPSTTEWVRKVVNIPSKMNPFSFLAHHAFSFQSSCFCFADPFQGILFYNMSGTDPGISFVPMPDELHGDAFKQDECPGCRHVACLNGSIKFFHIQEKQPATVTIWNLENRDPMEWTVIHKINFEDLWADASFPSNKIPTWVPLFPTMSPEEDDMIYFLVDRGCYRYGDIDFKLDRVVIVGINLQSKKLQSCSHEPMTPDMLVPALHPEHLFHKAEHSYLQA